MTRTCAGLAFHHFGETNAVVCLSCQTMSLRAFLGMSSSPARNLQKGQAVDSSVMPKTLTGVELQLDDAPARESELFLVDGNNLAYRAFFALPEELATSDCFSTNALLGFTNMLFKLLSDYRPKGVAVAWDTRPVHRAALSDDYKSERRPMPDLLREQFPHFRPIVEAFGYR